MNKIIIIQNTTYHFETTISLYQILTDLGYDVYVHRCDNNVFNQGKFCEINNIQLTSPEILESKDILCGIVISAYPYPASRIDVPNAHNFIFSILKNKLIFIGHKFKHAEHYDTDKLVNRNNAICLSPLSQNIGVDFIHLTDMPIKPIDLSLSNDIAVTVQAHFRLRNRNTSILDSIKNYNINLNIVGTRFVYQNTIPENMKIYMNLDELAFYDIINNTHFILAPMDPSIKKGTYSSERYSSNFNLCLALNKPIITHQFFKDIYNIPGIYYSSYDELAEIIHNISIRDYNILFNSFSGLKQPMREHNKNIIQKKLNYIYEKI